MNPELSNYKAEVVKRGRRIRHLSEELGIPYNRLSRILNGYDSPPTGFAMDFIKVINKWDIQKMETKNGKTIH